MLCHCIALSVVRNIPIMIDILDKNFKHVCAASLSTESRSPADGVVLSMGVSFPGSFIAEF